MSETNDHDLLITVLGEIRQLKDDIKDIKDNTKATLTDHEKRLRLLEQSKWKTAGYVGLGVLIITLFVTYFAGHHLSIQ